MITCRNISKAFKLQGRPVRVLEDVSLSVAARESVAILGPSGCGKSTLLALIAGFYPPDAGVIEVSGRISMMTQDEKLLPHRSVLANVCLPVEIRARRRLVAAREQASRLLPLFGLAGFGESFPAQLSGGMRQRAALLRIVMDEGEVWLLDEPFARLDALTKEELQERLFGIKSRYASSLLLVTHDMEEALLLADRIYVLGPRPGRVVGELAVDKTRHQEQKARLRELLAGGQGA